MVSYKEIKSPIQIQTTSFLKSVNDISDSVDNKETSTDKKINEIINDYTIIKNRLNELWNKLS